MEGYIHGLMAVYHARLLRSLSCVLGARASEIRRGGTNRETKSKEEADRARGLRPSALHLHLYTKHTKYMYI